MPEKKTRGKGRKIASWFVFAAGLLFSCLCAAFAAGLIGPGDDAVDDLPFDDGGFVYTGAMDGGRFDGYGEMTFGNGDTYEGGFKGGRFDGFGKFTGADGALIYEGEFREGMAYTDEAGIDAE